MNAFSTFTATIAFLAGLAVYRWQKSLDRSTQILSERRTAYARYMQARMMLQRRLHQDSGQSLDAEILEFRCALAALLVSSSEDVATAAVRHEVAFVELYQGWKSKRGEEDSTRDLDTLFQEETNGFVDLMKAMRNEITGHSAVFEKFRKRDTWFETPL